LDLSIWILAGIVIFIASLTMSVAGFGFGLIATPLLFLFLDSRLVVLFSTGLGSIIGLLVFLQARKYANAKIMSILGLTSLAGLPIGVYLISHVSSPILKIIIGVLVIIFAVLFGTGRTFKITRENLGSAVSGFIGGVLMSGAGLGGPPVIMFLLNQEHEKHAFRASIAFFLVISGIASFAALGISGTVTSANLVQTLTFIPMVVIAYYTGIKILPHINQTMFKKIVLAIILISGTAGIITAAVSLAA
jgi:uncharacterized protein